jgi:outer membrane lipoprotein-sorting protein
MKNILMALFVAMGFGAAHAEFAEDLLRASDQGRGGVKEGLTWNIKIETTEEGETNIRNFIVKAKLNDAYVESTAPPRNKGEVFLFNDRSMWFYKPGLKKPVAISSRQKLSGQAANGDIASTQYARDYSATLEKTETVDGEKMHVLMLKAKAENLTYDKIRYWISDSTKLAKKAEFLTLQGVPFKLGVMEYGNQVSIDGKKLPFISKLKITDAKYKENFSVITYDSPKIENHADSIFNVNRLSR